MRLSTDYGFVKINQKQARRQWDSARLQQLAKTIKIESTGLELLYMRVYVGKQLMCDTVTLDGKQMPAGIATTLCTIGTISNGTVPENCS